MFIKPTSVDALKAHADIETVVSHYTELKRAGQNLEACCPLPNHDEKTPSFKVSQSKNIFKCFGCGKGGDPIKFVMEMDGLDFPEAVCKVADITNFTLEYENNFSESEKKAYEEARKRKRSLQALMDFALEYYQSKPIPEQWYKARGWSLEVLKKLNVGFAPEVWHEFMDAALQAGFDTSQLLEAGLIGQKEKEGGKLSMYDTFRGRVLFPIFNAGGSLLHFSGRTTKKDKQTPKYINGTDTRIYKKGESLYGLSHALRAIQKQEFVYFVEGAPNVVRLHHEGKENVVAALGTGLTDKQIKLLKKYTSRIVYIPDNDHKKNEKTGELSNPGFDAFDRNAKRFIEHGFTVSFLTTEVGTDVDEYLKLWSGEKLSKKQWFDSAQDFISEFKLTYAVGMKDNPARVSECIKELWEIIDSIPDNVVKTMYHSVIKKELPEFAKVKKLALDESEQLNKKLKDIDRNKYEAFIEDGFSEQNGCYVAFRGDKEVEVTNFTMEMLFFVKSAVSPKWIVKIQNQFGYTVVIPIDSKDLTNPGKFEEVISSYGNFLFFGSKADLNRIKRKLFVGVKQAIQPSYLGWNRLGFWAWSNGIIYEGKFHQADKYGMVELLQEIKSVKQLKALPKETRIVIQGQDHVLDDADALLKELNADGFAQLIKAGEVKQYQYIYLPYCQRLDNSVGDEDDNYADIRKFKFHHESDKLTFNEWANQMVRVYHKNAPFMIANVISTIFKDIIFKANHNWFPIEFHFGEKQSGKSQAMDSEAAMFGHVKPGGINIHSGGSTTTGIGRIMANFQNAVIVLNEYKNTLHDAKIEMLKSFADGAGKVTAKKTMGLETGTTKSRSVPVVGGQDMPTKEAALLSRCNILRWTSENRNPKAFKTLKDWEAKGRCTWVVNELLQHRQLLIDHYEEAKNSIAKLYEKEFEESGIGSGDGVSDREVLNKATLLAAISVLRKNTSLDFGFDWNQFFMACMENTIALIEIQQTSDEVETFISVLFSITDVEGHIASKPVKLGEHLMVKRNESKELLYLRLRSAYPYYKEACVRRGDTPMAESGIKSYLMNHRYFIEKKTNARFGDLSNPTSAMVLDYELIKSDGLILFTEV